MSTNAGYPCERDMEKNRLLGIIEGASARTIFNLTSGAFLVGLLKYMNANNTVLGYVLAIPVLAAVIQFLSPIVLESLPSRLKIITVACALHRFLLASLIAIPFLPMTVPAKLWSAGIIFFISYLAVSFINPAASSMYVSFVPQNIRGKYFGMRESYMLAFSTVITLILGKVLDLFTDAKKEITGYVIVYAVIFVLAAINSGSFLLMKEVPLVHSKDRIKISEIFTLPFKDKRFIVYFIMLIIWNLSIQIAGAYFSVYLKSDLNLNYTTITVLSTVNSLVYILTARKWGKFADKNGWAQTTMLTIGILGLTHSLWFFVSVGSPLVLILLSITHIMSGIAWSGINVALFNLQFDFTPDEKRTVYIGFSAAVSGIIGYISAMLGAQLVGLFGKNKIVLAGANFDIKQILFITSGILLLVCSIFIGTKMKPHAINKEVSDNG